MEHSTRRKNDWMEERKKEGKKKEIFLPLLIYDMIFIYCNCVSTRWQWFGKLVQK
jgi:hypothetical protein